MEKLFRTICMAPMGEGGEGGGGTGAGGGDTGAGAGGGEGAGGDAGAGGGAQGAGNGSGSGPSQFVPYARFQEMNTKYRDLESKHTQLQNMMDQLKGVFVPGGQKKNGFKLDFQNPEKSIEDFVKAELEAREKAIEERGSQREAEVRRSAAIKWFKSQEDYSPDMEEKAAAFIKENGLQGLDPQKAIELAYKFVTMGDGSGYTRKVKEGIIKPGAGGKGKGEDIQTEMAKLDPKDPQYDEKMRALHAKLIAGGK